MNNRTAIIVAVLIVPLVWFFGGCTTSKPSANYAFTDGASGLRLEHCGCGCVNLMDVNTSGAGEVDVKESGKTGLDADVKIKLTK